MASIDGPSRNGMEKVQSDDTGSNSIGRATYPLPPPLASILTVCCKNASNGEISVTGSIEREDPIQAIQCIVENSIAAIDSLYFATPPRIRDEQECFGHRSCLRVVADREHQTLTITDLGIGMTRADLINCLGIGRAIASSGVMRKKGGKSRSSGSSTVSSETGTESSDDDDDDDDDNGDNSVDSDSSSDGKDDNGDEAKAENGDSKDHEPGAAETKTAAPLIPAKKRVIGGFYAALCALGTAVKVGTKSKFDDYYEFQVGTFKSDDSKTSADGNGKSASDFQQFVLTRPLPEGSALTVEAGFDKLQHVRGDSGTMVCIQLRDDLVDTMMDYTKLHGVFEKLLETTHTSVALGNSDQASDLIDATRREQELRNKLMEEIDEDEALDIGDSSQDDSRQNQMDSLYSSVKERAKYIPLRLSLNERKMLRLVEAAMTCCDYTSEVDGVQFKSQLRRVHTQIKAMSSIFRGLVTACDYEAGRKIAKDEIDLSNYQKFLQTMMELARRHKIRNPEKMRTEYGKLIYLLQDAVHNEEHLNMNVIRPIESVYKFLEERGGLKALEDPHIETATEEILAERKTRATIDSEIRRKEKAVQQIKKKYRSNQLSSEDIHLCLYSICDNNSFLNSNRVPIDKVIDFLKTHFSPDEMDEEYSLAIISGEGGARLSHSHERQYYFALQSLTLWRDIIDDMFRLWAMGEGDLLNPAVKYSLQDTGQGMQRVQQSPQTYRAMQRILMRVQGKVKQWIGSSVIHLGDHNVPNALSFIDKYTQVPRILGPIVVCLENVEKLCEEDDGIQSFVDDGFGGIEKLRKDILYDFFRSAFDGSGANNFYDAGSCIDGRLTSAWNWCSQLPEKPFYPIFLLTGFVGFDGEFK